MVCILISSFVLTTSAETPFSNETILGTESDNTGYLVPDTESEVNKSRAGFSPIFKDEGTGSIYTEIFSITAVQVTELLASSKGAKSFSNGTLPDAANYILCRATLEHSLENVVNITSAFAKAGICYYGYNELYGEDTYIAVATISFFEEDLGKTLERKDAISDIVDWNESYYSYVKNCYPSGYVYGTVSLYYSAV